MPIALIVKGVATAVISHELVVGAINRRRCNKNAEIAQNLQEQVRYLDAFSDYLIEVIERNEIPVTEFDQIAINNL